MPMTKELKYVCAICGQKNEIGLCLRCDRVCGRCQQNLRNHHLVEGLQLCPTVVFEWNGEVREP